MTEYKSCSGCGAVIVPVNQLCFDCWCPTPQKRQDEILRLNETISELRKTLRDRFALGVYPTALELLKRDGKASLVMGQGLGKLLARYAYELADELLEARSRPGST